MDEVALLRGSSVGGDAAEATVGKSKCVGNHFLVGIAVELHTLSKIFDSLPPHTEVRVKARFHFIDKWNGENAYLKVDGGYAWLASHKTLRAKACTCAAVMMLKKASSVYQSILWKPTRPQSWS